MLLQKSISPLDMPMNHKSMYISVYTINLCMYIRIYVLIYILGDYGNNEGDYVIHNYYYTFDNPADAFPVIISPLDDNIVELDEYFILNISLVNNPEHFMIVNKTINVTISEDDGK